MMSSPYPKRDLKGENLTGSSCEEDPVREKENAGATTAVRHPSPVFVVKYCICVFLLILVVLGLDSVNLIQKGFVSVSLSDVGVYLDDTNLPANQRGGSEAHVSVSMEANLHSYLHSLHLVSAAERDGTLSECMLYERIGEVSSQKRFTTIRALGGLDLLGDYSIAGFLGKSSSNSINIGITESHFPNIRDYFLPSSHSTRRDLRVQCDLAYDIELFSLIPLTQSVTIELEYEEARAGWRIDVKQEKVNVGVISVNLPRSIAHQSAYLGGLGGSRRLQGSSNDDDNDSEVNFANLFSKIKVAIDENPFAVDTVKDILGPKVIKIGNELSIIISAEFEYSFNFPFDFNVYMPEFEVIISSANGVLEGAISSGVDIANEVSGRRRLVEFNPSQFNYKLKTSTFILPLSKKIIYNSGQDFGNAVRADITGSELNTILDFGATLNCQDIFRNEVNVDTEQTCSFVSPLVSFGEAVANDPIGYATAHLDFVEDQGNSLLVNFAGAHHETLISLRSAYESLNYDGTDVSEFLKELNTPIEIPVKTFNKIQDIATQLGIEAQSAWY